MDGEELANMLGRLVDLEQDQAEQREKLTLMTEELKLMKEELRVIKGKLEDRDKRGCRHCNLTHHERVTTSGLC